MYSTLVGFGDRSREFFLSWWNIKKGPHACPFIGRDKSEDKIFPYVIIDKLAFFFLVYVYVKSPIPIHLHLCERLSSRLIRKPNGDDPMSHSSRRLNWSIENGLSLFKVFYDAPPRRVRSFVYSKKYLRYNKGSPQIKRPSAATKSYDFYNFRFINPER